VGQVTVKCQWRLSGGGYCDSKTHNGGVDREGEGVMKNLVVLTTVAVAIVVVSWLDGCGGHYGCGGHSH